MVVYITIYNTERNPSKNYKMCNRRWRFSFAMGFQNASENVAHGFGNLVI